MEKRAGHHTEKLPKYTSLVRIEAIPLLNVTGLQLNYNLPLCLVFD
jgi:hypothetical protein